MHCVKRVVMRNRHLFVVMLVFVIGVSTARAQWITQSVTLKSGWNSVYLHVDASHTTLQELVGADPENPISEVWLWNPASTMQFVNNPQEPVAESSQWASWHREDVGNSLLQRLIGNAAYLVCVTNVATYTWNIKGRPVPPTYPWTSAGMNFIGFPTVPTGAPTFQSFLEKAPDLYNNAQIFRYVGGAMGANNPAALPSALWRSVKVERGQAFWMCKTNFYNTYFGPFEVDLNGAQGLFYGDSLSVRSVRLRNFTTNNLTVSVVLNESQTPPEGQTNIVGVPPMLIRGSLNPDDMTHVATPLMTDYPISWTLNPKGTAGSEVEVVFGVDRSAMWGLSGDLQAGVLSFTDSLGFTKVDLPVSANLSTSAGLWVGNAVITQVGEYLKQYAKDGNNELLTETDPASPNFGAYIVTGTNTTLGNVPRPYPLRLIVHNPVGGNPAVLLQQVFCGVDADKNPIVSISEEDLNRDYLKQSRRISASHLPWSAGNGGWSFNMSLDGGMLQTTVTTEYDDAAANPFVHSYHPDHDNLNDASGERLAQGAESYTIKRDIVLWMVAPGADFESHVFRNATLSGDYTETITLQGLQRGGGPDTREFHVRGIFTLNRISDVPVLTGLQGGGAPF